MTQSIYCCWFVFSDTYEKGKQDILVEESMEMSEDEADKEKVSDKEEKPLLPPEVFEHLKTAAGTEEKKEEKLVTGKNKNWMKFRLFITIGALHSYSSCSNSMLSQEAVILNKISIGGKFLSNITRASVVQDYMRYLYMFGAPL